MIDLRHESYAGAYLALFENTRAYFQTHTPLLMNKQREKAYALLQEYGLPKTDHEDYKRFDVQRIFSRKALYNSEIVKHKVREPEKKFGCSLHHMAGLRFFMYNDSVCMDSATRSAVGTIEQKGAFVGSIRRFALEKPEIMERYYDQIVQHERNTLATLNTLLARDAFVLYVPAGLEIEETVQLIAMPTEEEVPLIFPRILIILEERAKANLLFCDHAQEKVAQLVSNAVLEAYVAKDACLTLYDMEETNDTHCRILNSHYKLMENAVVKTCPLTITNGKTRNNIFAYLEGIRSSFTVAGFSVLDGEKKTDTYVWVNHAVSHCHSDQLLKYTINDSAVGSFTGRIFVAQDAQKTMAYQNNRNLSLSPKAKVYSKPQLEIYADDVRCSHGLTIGQMDENALFYMRQRGIPYMEAKLLLTIAFVSDVLEHIELEPLKKTLADILDKRYRGGNASCCEQRSLS